MSYSHQWYLSPHARPDAYAAALAGIRAAIAACSVKLCNAQGNGPPITDTGISINGAPGAGGMGEGFRLPETPEGLLREPSPTWDREHRRIFNFCKTYQLPYDAVVTAALAILKDRLGNDILVYSDGEPSNWEEGIRLASSVMGRPVACPLT